MIKLNNQTVKVKISFKQILAVFLILLSTGLLTFDIGSLNVKYPYDFLQNYSHVIIFVIIIQTIYILLSNEKYKLRITIMIAAIIAFSTEIFQIYNSRDADLFDLLLNFSGIGIAVLWILLKSNPPKPKRKYAKICAIGLVSITISAFLSEIGSVLYSQYRFNKMLPTLANFENEWELQRWYHKGISEIKLSNDFSTLGNSCVKAKFNTSKYPRLGLQRIPPDWSQYLKFSFDIFNPQNEILDLHLRFDDSHSKSYATRGRAVIKIFPGNNNIQLPIKEIEKSSPEGILNMKDIQKVVLFLYKPANKFTLFFDYFRLE